jgi:NADH:ubiquinone oxidoreductase subunit K
MMITQLMVKAALFFAVMIFSTGICCIFLRRLAIWSLVGQLTAMKAVAAAAFILSRLAFPGKADLEAISLLAAAFIPAAAFVGLVVLHRCGRFGASLDYDRENELRN